MAEFDYIVVGAGAAGSVVRSILSFPPCRRSVRPLRASPLTVVAPVPWVAVTRLTLAAPCALLSASGRLDAAKPFRTVTSRLRLSVLEDALLGFAQGFGIQIATGAAVAVPAWPPVTLSQLLKMRPPM